MYNLRVIGLIFVIYEMIIILIALYINSSHFKRKIILLHWCNSCWCRRGIDCEKDSKLECVNYIKTHFKRTEEERLLYKIRPINRCTCDRPHILYGQKCPSCGKINNGPFFTLRGKND
jgi:hypothetical protein